MNTTYKFNQEMQLLEINKRGQKKDNVSLKRRSDHSLTDGKL